MLGELLKALLIPSLAGTCLAAVITLAKPITKKVFGYAWHYYIWLAVLIIMVLPVRFSLPQQADAMPVAQTQTVQTMQPAKAVVPHTEQIPVVQTEPKPEILQTGTSLVKMVMDRKLLAYVWLMGAVGLLLINLVGYSKLMLKMRRQSEIVCCPQLAGFTKRKVTVRVWEHTSSPFMAGLIKPTLVLPAGELTEEQLNNILRHEMTHLKRHDMAYKWVAQLVKCIHWFNPVIWYVAKQINAECEISCDMAVTVGMSRDEEMRYIDTVLSLLPAGKTKQIPLTTQMTGNKKMLKRRFKMIRNKKRTSKWVSAISAALAAVLLGTTVFASGVFAGAIEENKNGNLSINGRNHTIEILHIDNIRYLNTDSYYAPLRRFFEQLGYQVYYEIPGSDAPDWMRETQRHFPEYSWRENLVSDEITQQIYGATTSANGNMPIIEIVSPAGEEIYCQVGSERYTSGWAPPVIMIDNTAYIPIRALAYIIGGDDTVKWSEEKHDTYYEGALTFDAETLTIDINTVVDASKLSVGKIMVDGNGVVVYNSENLKNPESVITSFFEAFADGNFTLMKNYCTQRCIDDFFGNDYVFGMKRASLQGISKDSDDLRQRGFIVGEWAALVNVAMTPDENSVYEPNQTEASFYMVLKQQNGRYLIDEFATGL